MNPERASIDAFIVDLDRRLADRPENPGPPPLPDAVIRQTARDADLVATYTAAATRAGMHVHRATPTDWLDTVASLLDADPAAKIIPPLPGDGWFTTDRVAALKAQLAGATLAEPTSDDDLFAADAAIAGVVGLIAETGSLVIASGPRAVRNATLVPPRLIAVAPARAIFPDTADALAHIAAWPTRPANVALVTGPSKTADVEGVLVTGVHGPGDVHVLVVAP